MKKFAICVLAVLVVAMFVPGAQAATKCYTFPNFCDHIQTEQTGPEVVGLWDWQCANQGTGVLASGTTNKIGTRPVYYPYNGNTAAGFAANFTFKPGSGLFDLRGTFDGVTVSTFQHNKPFSVAFGSCNPLGPRNPGRSTTGR